MILTLILTKAGLEKYYRTVGKFKYVDTTEKFDYLLMCLYLTWSSFM